MTDINKIFPAKQLGKMIRTRRLDRDLTQRDVEQLTGISQHMISRLESGSSKPTLNTLSQIMDGLGLDVWDLAKVLDPENPKNSVTVADRGVVETQLARMNEMLNAENERLRLEIEALRSGRSDADKLDEYGAEVTSLLKSG